MIRSENEYQMVVARLAEEQAQLSLHAAGLRGMGLPVEQLERAMEPLLTFHLQLQDEVVAYERIKRGELPVYSFDEFGKLLTALRISKGLNQRQLAEKLGVHESAVSRDERNEYRGITIERAQKILAALGAKVNAVVETDEG